MPDRSSVLVVAGEASGDRLAASVAGVLRRQGKRPFGVGGAACAAAGVELVADLAELTAMGTVEVAARLPWVVDSLVRLRAIISERAPSSALLVDFTEYNLLL